MTFGLACAALGLVLRVARVSAWALLLAACSSAPVKPDPPALEALEINPAAPAMRLLWSQRVSAVQFPVEVASLGDVFTLASDDGTVVALEAVSGHELWRGSAGAKLSSGVGTDGHTAAVVTTDGSLVALEAGRPLWRKTLHVRVATRPLVAGQRVFVLATDRSVHAFDGASGHSLWSVRRPGDALTLNQVGVLLAVGNTLVVGQGARLAGLDPANGSLQWEVPLATPRGTNEIERLADLVGPAGRSSITVCARAFQASVGCANAARGSLLWTRAVGGTKGVATDAQLVVAADASDRVTAWHTATGDVAWTSEALLHRDLSTPVLMDAVVAFGDAAGTVHLLSRENGKTLVRLSTDGSAIEALALGAAGPSLLAVTRRGGVYAFRP
jgi:outer membrane protein assembly factor BamB